MNGSGGTRGGADYFQWDSVKEDQYRENYLGHSLMAPVGRWQRNKDLTWYSKRKRKDNDVVDEAAAEREAIKCQDAEALDEFMGIAHKGHGEGDKGSQHQLENLELKALLAREGAERDTIDVERIQGLGAAPSRGHEHMPTLTLREKEIARREKAARAENSVLQEGDMVQVVDLKEEERKKAERKAEKKERKKEKKNKKSHPSAREKKERKRRRKEHRYLSGKRTRHDSSDEVDD